MKHYTPTACMTAPSRKRQSAIDLIRMVKVMREEMEEAGMTIDIVDFDNVIYTFQATLPKTDQEELLHG